MARLSVKELEKLAGKSFEEIQAGEQSFKRNSAFDIDRNLDVLNALKDQVKAGDLTVAEFLDRSRPFAEEANRSLLGANDPSLFGRVPQLRQFANFDTASGLGQITDARLPFSSREFARLPADVLPLLDEVNKGIIPVDVLPPGAFERIQRDQKKPLDNQLDGLLINFFRDQVGADSQIKLKRFRNYHLSNSKGHLTSFYKQ